MKIKETEAGIGPYLKNTFVLYACRHVKHGFNLFCAKMDFLRFFIFGHR